MRCEMKIMLWSEVVDGVPVCGEVGPHCVDTEWKVFLEPTAEGLEPRYEVSEMEAPASSRSRQGNLF